MHKNKYNHIDDNTLLELYYNDYKSEWLGELMQRYTLVLLGVCMKYLKDEEAAKDAVQQVFLKAIHEIQKYKVTYFKSWIYIIAKNYCLMQLRAKGNINLELSEQYLSTPDSTIDFLGILDKEKKLNLLEAALENLNTEQKQCVTLFYLEKKSYQEIVTITDLSLMQVKSNIQNGKRNLKLILNKESE